MKTLFHRVWPLTLIASLMSCNQKSDAPKPAPNATDANSSAPDAIDDNPEANLSENNSAPENRATTTKSILRPDIAASEHPVEHIEALHAVIGFGESGLELDDAGRTAIDALLDQSTTKAGGPIVVRGHTDSRGHDADNRAASMKRAEAVRDYLVSKGVASDRITLVALGETRPIAPNALLDGGDNPEGRAKNRRAEIEILPPVTVAAPHGEPENTSSQ